MDLLYKNEKPLFVIMLTFSLLVWAAFVVGTFGTIFIYVLFIYIFYLFAQSAVISYLKGTAVRITPEQFPDIHERLLSCCKKLEMDKIPEIYILHGDGVFNAFAMRFLKRDYVVLLSDMVDALEDQPGALNFYIGHELGHIHRKHLIWGPVLFPAAVLPIIGAAYSRAREYTCDNYGFACCDDHRDALTGLSVLSAGSKRWRTLKIENYTSQADAAGGFWMSFHELVSGYPWLVKRMSHISSRVEKKNTQFPRRHPLAWFFAMFIPRTMGNAGGAAVLIVVAFIGILAAIAIPYFIGYKNRAMHSIPDHSPSGYETGIDSESENNGYSLE
ncbi:MAG: M48 family metalloprotease [Desulfatitalea sp.]|nr:M48 family metalloprotease [Desulfatitalea sp.]